ncbi:hypothetical protein ACSTS3_14100 [Aquimarina muelleri]|uniref:hypothetical protein n=1 Tax=Aquimarina muelleri TaxID=279356 RepID=UPI003F682FB6
MENNLYFYGLFSTILSFCYFIYRVTRNIKVSNNDFVSKDSISLQKFKEQADKITIDLQKIEFRHQTNQKENFDFKLYERDILLESDKSKKYIEYKNRGVIEFKYKNKFFSHLICVDNVPEKNVLTYFYLKKETTLYIDKQDIAKRYIDLKFLEKATQKKFKDQGIEYLDLETYDLEIKHSMYK